jgi:hypothetical protein
MTTPGVLSVPSLTKTGMSYVVKWEEGVEIQFRGLYAHKDKNVDAFVTILDYAELAGPRLLGPFRGSISKTWRSVITELNDISERGDWRQRLTQASALVQAAYASGQPAVALGLIDSPPTARELIQNVLWAGTPAIIFGPPGIGKSLFGLHLISSTHLGRPFANLPSEQKNSMWLDWETNQSLAHWRNKEIMDSLGLDAGVWPDPERPDLQRSGLVYYKQMVGPLADSIESLSEEIAAMNVGVLLVDSANPACGGEAESGQATESFYAALRALKADEDPLSVIIIAHMTKASQDVGKANYSTPFGSVFWTARARDTYELKASKKKNSNYADLMLHHRKTNMGPLREPLAFRMSWGPANIETLDVRANAELVAGLPYGDRAHILIEQHGPLKTEELADLMDLSKRTLASTLSRDDRFEFEAVNGRWTPSGVDW